MEKEIFDHDGILLGWMCKANSFPTPVFIPRRDEDVEQDRAAIAALIKRATKK